MNKYFLITIIIFLLSGCSIKNTDFKDIILKKKSLYPEVLFSRKVNSFIFEQYGNYISFKSWEAQYNEHK